MKEDVKGKKIKCVDFELLPDELQELQIEREFGGEKNKLVLQPLGKIVIEFLVTHFNSLFEYDFTKRMEDDLDKVAKGELHYKDICTYCMSQVTDLTRELKDKNIPVLCMHGTADNTVPYGTAVIKLFNTIPLLNVSGSSSIRKALNDKQIVNRFYTFCGLDHVPFLGTTAVQKSWMDTTVLFISQFLYYDVLKLSAVNPNANIQEIDSADCATTGIYATPIAAAKISPNPTPHSVLVELKNSNAMLQQIAIMDLTGRVVGLHNIDNENQTSVDLQNFDKGIYLLKIITSEGMIIERIIKE
jgi:hypothetical protein